MGCRDLTGWLRDAIAESRGKPVLLLGDVAADLQADNLTHVIRPAPGDVLASAGRRFDLAVVVGVLEALDREPAAALLAELRDLTARRLLVAVPASPGDTRCPGVWTRDEMLAHGLDALGEAMHEGETLAVYGFDIDQYKRTPEWLNPSGWANPENWGKYRW